MRETKLLFLFTLEKQCHKNNINQKAAAETQSEDTIDKKEDKPASYVKCSSSLNTKGSGHIMGKHSSPDSYTEECKQSETAYISCSHEELMALKDKKKIIQTATEKFNTKPKVIQLF